MFFSTVLQLLGVGLSVYYFRGSESSEMLLTETPGLSLTKTTGFVTEVDDLY